MIEDMKRNIEARNLGPEQIFSASMIAGINSFGILNQAVMSSAARQMGKDLAEYYIASNPTAAGNMAGANGMDTIGTCRKTIDILQSMLRITEEIKCQKEGDAIFLRMRASKCRYCPKGVGRAELKGTLCPFPTLIQEFINTLDDRTVITVLKAEAAPLLNREDDWCVVKYTAAS
jgi:hypothetical protein